MHTNTLICDRFLNYHTHIYILTHTKSYAMLCKFLLSNGCGDTQFVHLQQCAKCLFSLRFTKMSRFRSIQYSLKQHCLYLCRCMRWSCVCVCQLRVVLHPVVCANVLFCHHSISVYRSFSTFNNRRITEEKATFRCMRIFSVGWFVCQLPAI